MALLDTNALLPPRLSDVLFDLALEGMYLPRWTSAIEAEFVKNFGHVVLAKDKAESKAIKAAPPKPDHIAKAKRRLHCFRAAAGLQFEVLLYDSPSYRKKVPPEVNAGDVHVASAALVLHELSKQEGCADKVFIVSSNLTHLAVKQMMAIGISVVSPGSFINELNIAAPAEVEKALLRTTTDLKTPALSPAELLGILVVHGARDTADFFAKKWDVKIPQRGLVLNLLC